MVQHYFMAYFGHHKAGTTWISKIINSVCLYREIKVAGFHSPEVFNYDLKTTITHNNITFFSYTNADISYVHHIPNLKGFHVVRDPRDIVVSAYFSHLYSHATEYWPELVEQRNRLRCLSKNEGLLLTIKFLEHLKVNNLALYLFDSMYNWDYSLHNIMELKFEDIISNPYEKFAEIFRFLGIGDDLKALTALKEALKENDFFAMSGGRSPGQEDIKNHYRKGVSGDWRNHFQKEHINYFKAKYNDLLIKLGYEVCQDW